ncbi:hypothetical protein MXD62_19630 [Frankia sp. Mgl5]|uniref:hypothetical protein n=1 Tax=Frankia sp. Mgl5 TaxID=2933793 RepID=UPI00200EC794|nr:hypothetical protein [Frankia sp. Mgl5]MCK9929364.1 hypothetical protein [Frankia sp. Mgl5]
MSPEEIAADELAFHQATHFVGPEIVDFYAQKYLRRRLVDLTFDEVKDLMTVHLFELDLAGWLS